MFNLLPRGLLVGQIAPPVYNTGPLASSKLRVTPKNLSSTLGVVGTSARFSIFEKTLVKILSD